MDALLILFLIICVIALTYAKFAARVKIGGALKAHYKHAPESFDYHLTQDFLTKIKPQLTAVISGAKTIMNFEDIPHKLSYISTKSVIKTPLHCGQVKLFLTELRFLTESLEKNQRAVVVYAGSAPSNKLQYLATLFPNVTFVLVDPNEHFIMYPGHKSHYDHNDTLYFCANPHPQFIGAAAPARWWDGEVKIGRRDQIPGPGTILPTNLAEIIAAREFRFYIIEDYFTNTTAKLLKSLGCYFISDIRSQFSPEESPRDIDILWNSAMMYNWLKILGAARFMLKFRTPYGFNADIQAEYDKATYTHADFAACDIEFIENYRARKFNYIRPGVVYMQAYAGPTSTESRLVGSTLDLQEWNCDDYNDKYFYYNRAHRSYGWHAIDTNIELGIDHCGDCAIMMQTVNNYREKWGVAIPAHDMISKLLYVCRRNLFDGSIHGHYFEKYSSVDSLINVQKRAYEAMVVEVGNAERQFRPMTVEQAYVIYEIIRSHPRVEHNLIGAWLLGWDTKLAAVSISEKLEAAGLDFVQISKKMSAPPPIEIERADDFVRAGDAKFPTLANIMPEIQLIARLTNSIDAIIEINSPALDKFADYKIIVRDPRRKINGRSGDYNILLDDVFNLPRDKYLISAQHMSHIGRQILAKKLKSRGRPFAIMTSAAGRTEKNILSDKHYEFDADVTEESGAASKKRYVVYLYD